MKEKPKENPDTYVEIVNRLEPEGGVPGITIEYESVNKGDVEDYVDRVKRVFEVSKKLRNQLEDIENDRLNKILMRFAPLPSQLWILNDEMYDKLKNWEKLLDENSEVNQKLLREKLEKNGVSGSAVIPNLKADPDWKQFVADENEALRTKISTHLIK